MTPSGAVLAPRFLEAEWRHLAMLNYEIDPSILMPRLPHGCELDPWDDRIWVSVVGFQFLRTRVLGIAIPYHEDFEEVNLRFYVRRKVEGSWRRGVVFVQELVPRPAIALVARVVYGENYVALPMRHSIARDAEGTPTRVAYEWRRRGTWEGLVVEMQGPASIPAEDSEAAFITEHYWGYSRQRGETLEYKVEHPRWAVWAARSATLSCDVASLYGPEFTSALSGAPNSAFVAEGSAVIVRSGRRPESDAP